jgi:hypothetical protein
MKTVLDESGSVIWVVLRKPIGKICGLSSIMHILRWSISAQCMTLHFYLGTGSLAKII